MDVGTDISRLVSTNQVRLVMVVMQAGCQGAPVAEPPATRASVVFLFFCAPAEQPRQKESWAIDSGQSYT